MISWNSIKPSGLGVYELNPEGEKVGNQVLARLDQLRFPHPLQGIR